jgi:hypothetical protein
MYTAQQIANSIASNAPMPAGNPNGQEQGAAGGLFPYPLVSAGGTQQQEWIGAGGTQSYPYGRDNVWAQNGWGNPSGSMPAMSPGSGGPFSQWSSADWVSGGGGMFGGGGNGSSAADPGMGAGGYGGNGSNAADPGMGAGALPAGSPAAMSAWVVPQANAARAFDLSGSGTAGCAVDADMYNDEKQSLYAGHRLFGNIRLAQGKGDVGEVLLNGTATIVNPALLGASVEGRNQVYATADAYRDDSNSFVPFATMGGSAGGIRPELYVGTISEGLSAPPKSELLTQRAFLPSDMPSTFNIYPESEAAAARKENTCRLNRIQANYIASRIAAASTMAW